MAWLNGTVQYLPGPHHSHLIQVMLTQFNGRSRIFIIERGHLRLRFEPDHLTPAAPWSLADEPEARAAQLPTGKGRLRVIEAGKVLERTGMMLPQFSGATQVRLPPGPDGGEQTLVVDVRALRDDAEFAA